ncbi:MAG TPA: carbon storage regulator [Bacillota bacterium]|nr:carbon storage regulator [Bacillota bacterium]HOK64102.1 carbon storage regulator [Bacillota bacterium]HOL11611.1 carbon storage regulator [Bacillota bacterium]HOQ02739.1 carbon storage regulator [Bacillota bacterium]HPP60493.1 carbon storage regulator [Bacillota bacterium]
MLVLSRKAGEAILVGDDILIRVTEIRGRGSNAVVKLGIEAPPGTRILREEVEAEIAREMTLAKDSVLDVERLKREFFKEEKSEE